MFADEQIFHIMETLTMSLRWSLRKGFFIAFLIEGLSRGICFGAFKEDRFESLTAFSPGVIIQSVQLGAHYKKAEETEKSFFLKKRDDAPKPKLSNLPLSWNFGFTYNRNSLAATSVDPEITNHTWGGNGGFNWEATPELDVGLQFAADFTPAEAYSHGSAVFQMGYLFNLVPSQKSKDLDELEKEDKDSKYDANNASQFYQRKQKEMEIRLAKNYLATKTGRSIASIDTEGERYPNIRVEYNLGFSRHLVDSKTFRRVSHSGGNITSTQKMDQYLNGLEVLTAISASFKFRLAAHVYSYSYDVDSYLNNFDAQIQVMQSIFADDGWTSGANQLLSFPSLGWNESFYWTIDDQNSLSFDFNQSTYASRLQSATFAFSASYFRNLTKSWRAGVLGNGTAGGVNSFLYTGALMIRYLL